MGDKVKLTYEVVQTTWNGKSHVFNNVCELLEVKNDNMTCACATNQIRSELEMVINMLKSICDKLAKSCEKSEDITQISKNDDELPF